MSPSDQPALLQPSGLQESSALYALWFMAHGTAVWVAVLYQVHLLLIKSPLLLLPSAVIQKWGHEMLQG